MGINYFIRKLPALQHASPASSSQQHLLRNLLHTLLLHPCMLSPRTQVPSAYKRNNNQQRQPGWVDLPALPPLTPEEQAALQQAAPSTPQQQPGWADQPYTANPAGNPGQSGGYMAPADPGYQVQTPKYAPPSKGPNRRNNNGGGGYQQQNAGGYPPLNDAFWGTPPSQQNGGWASRSGQGRNNFNRGAGFQGFDDPTTELLLQVGYQRGGWFISNAPTAFQMCACVQFLLSITELDTHLSRAGQWQQLWQAVATCQRCGQLLRWRQCWHALQLHVQMLRACIYCSDESMHLHL
jgi:hypothetical protein